MDLSSFIDLSLHHYISASHSLLSLSKSTYVYYSTLRVLSCPITYNYALYSQLRDAVYRVELTALLDFSFTNVTAFSIHNPLHINLSVDRGGRYAGI